MADCDSVDEALKRLQSKIDDTVKKINDLEKNCCDKGGSNGKSFDPTAILKRLDELEGVVRKLAKYTIQTDDAIKVANQALQAVTDLFKF